MSDLAHKWLGRGALAMFTLVCIVMVLSAGPRYRQLAVVADNPNLEAGQLLPENGEALVELGLSARFFAAYFATLEAALALVFLVIALRIVWRRSGDRAATLFAMTLAAFPLIASPYTTALAAESQFWQTTLLLLRTTGLTTLAWAFLVFPDGRFWPRWTLVLAFLWAIPQAVSLFYLPMRFPTSLLWQTPGQLALTVWVLFFLAAMSAVQLHRYRSYYTARQKQQTKWVVFGFGVAVGLFLLAAAPVLAVPVLGWPATRVMAIRIISFTTILLAGILFGLSIAVAILRHRLYDIDVIIRKTLVYSLLTGSLALVYFVCVVVLQNTFAAVAGRSSPVVVVVSTLVIAALFSPLRRRIQQTIDRRFFRRKYDAEETLAAFASVARDEVDLDHLSAELAEVVQVTMQPAQVSLWLRPDPSRKRSGRLQP